MQVAISITDVPNGYGRWWLWVGVVARPVPAI